jgi:hypothetical protein
MKKIKKVIYLVAAFVATFLTSSYGKIASAQTPTDSTTTGGWHPDTLAADSGLPSGTISGIISNFMLWALGIFGILAIIGFVISGIMYIVSAGSEDTMKKAKQAMVYSIIGVVVALSGLVAIVAIDAMLNQSASF